MTVCEHFSQRSTCPPSAAVRQRSIADITLSWPRLIRPALGRAPRRPVVAEDIRDLQLRTGHCGGLRRRRLHFLAVLLSFPGVLFLGRASRSSGLSTAEIVPVATWR